MKTTINFYDFEQAFRNADRFDNFGYEGLKVLFEYLEEIEESLGDEIEIDVIALCCEYSRDDCMDIADIYGIDLDDCLDDDERVDTIRAYLEDHTSVVGEIEEDGDTSFVYAAF